MIRGKVRGTRVARPPVSAAERRFRVAVLVRQEIVRCASFFSSRVGLSDLPQGREYYAYLVRLYTTTDMIPDEIHQLGLREVARIRGEMDELARQSGYRS